MIARKPSINIYCHCEEKKILCEICAGIEEEGVFFEIVQIQEKNAEMLAYEAANTSILGVGIGIFERTAVFTAKGMRFGASIEYYDDPCAEQCRKMGSNSARIVKRNPLKWEWRTKK